MLVSGMAVFINSRKDSPLRSVEFAPSGQGNISFIHVADPAQGETVRQLLTSKDVGQEITAETELNGKPVLMTRGGKTQVELLAALGAQGESLKAKAAPKKKFNPWAWRGITSIVGQSLQLVSGFKSSNNPADRAAIIGFASTNLVANGTNIIFGAQQKDDPHQLRVLKQEFNKRFEKFLPSGERLPSPYEDRLSKRPKERQSAGEKASNVIRQYSVTGGEIGLRFLGATSLAFPAPKVWNAIKDIRGGKPTGEALLGSKNTNPVTYNVGLITLAGKVTSLFSKETDPFNPKKHTVLDTIREKVTFPLSSVIEGAAAAWMAYDRFAKQKVMLFGKERPDYFGGVGNLVFVGGYVIRFFAPYGSREVNMPELTAHISDSLAKMPREQLPQLVMESAKDLKQHFKNKPLEVSDFYTMIAVDLKKYNHIDLSAPAGAGEPAREFAAAQQDVPSRRWATGKPAATLRERLNLADAVPADASPAM